MPACSTARSTIPLDYDPSQVWPKGVQSGQYPQQAPDVSGPVLVQSTVNPASPEIKTAGMTSTRSLPVQADERKARRERIHVLWGEIAQASDAKSLMKEIKELYLLHLQSINDSSFAGERARNRSIWGGMIRNYLSGNQSQNRGGVPRKLSGSQAEALMLMDEHEAYRFGRYSEAQKKVTEYAPYITSTRGKIVHMTDNMNLLDRQGSYKEELALLDKVKQAEVSLGVSGEQVNASYQIAAEEMQSDLDKQTAAKSGSDISAETPGNEHNATTSTKPVVTALKPTIPIPLIPRQQSAMS